MSTAFRETYYAECGMSLEGPRRTGLRDLLSSPHIFACVGAVG